MSSDDGKIYSVRNSGNTNLANAGLNYAVDVDFRPNDPTYLYGGCICDKKIYEFNIDNQQKRTFIDTTKDDIYAVSHSSDSSFLAAGGKVGYFWIINSTDRLNPSI